MLSTQVQTEPEGHLQVVGTADFQALGLPEVPQEEQTQEVDQIDQATPDNWIPRDSRLVRLTGKHPFNSEARVDDLLSAGFITPSNLFYVRNHGAVPRVSVEQAESWTITVSGLVENEQSFSLRDLKDLFETVTCPVTLVCAGNRRKEQNIVNKSLGFGWGAGGVSTALWTGVYLADVLEYCKLKRGARHCVFEGTDALPQGPYGTSQRLSWCKDKQKGFLIAWAMNGRPLEPDHGFPVRIIIPGQIGGRSVKWLSKIEVSAQESQHYLHYHDNKVLPTQLTADAAREQKSWWYDPAFIINELNVNSAIADPTHDQKVAVPNDAKAVYNVRGYAYAGGGRRVNRVELTLDEGKTWRLAQITYPEDSFRQVCVNDPVYGRLDLSDSDLCHCWCFWSFQVSFQDLLRASTIAVRGMDEGLALQPEKMYWNPTGMMNNPWFRVAIHHQQDQLVFEHPTMAGAVPGGWMQRLKDEGLDPYEPFFGSMQHSERIKPSSTVKKAEVPMTKPDVKRAISPEELAANKGKNWFVVKGEVYDGTDYLQLHPGGPDSITLVDGEDATDDFLAIHSPDAKAQLAAFHIGSLSAPTIPQSQPQEQDKNDAVFLNPKQWKSTRLASIVKISHDSRLFRFALDRDDQPLGLPTGQHCFVRIPTQDGEHIQRAYTPVSFTAVGYVDFLVKVYFPNEKFPSGGRMSMAFEQLKVGDLVQLKGPLGAFTHCGKGVVRWQGKERRVRQYGLVCGGTGITPIMQVLRGVLSDAEDKEACLSVLNGNRAESDILMRAELDKMAHQHQSRLRIHHTLSTPPDGWAFGKGRMSQNDLLQHLPAPSPEHLICVCGPGPMQDSVLAGLQSLGWDVSKDVVVF